MTTTTTAPLNREIPGVTTAAERALAASNPNRPVQGHIWTPTGGRVLANDMQEIIREMISGETTYVMSPPEDFLANDTPESRYDYTAYSYPLRDVVVTERKQFTSQNYRADWDVFMHDWVGKFFLGTCFSWWPPNPAVSYYLRDWWQDGLSGFGQDWTWVFGNRTIAGMGWDYLYKTGIYHIAVQSHRIDRNTRRAVETFLPVHPPSS